MKKIIFIFILFFLITYDLYSDNVLKLKCKSYVGKVSYYFTNQPLILKNRVYFVTKGDSSGSDRKDKLYAFSNNCKLLWVFSPDDSNTNLNGVVGNENMVVVSTDGGTVYAVNASGRVIWKYYDGKKITGLSMGDVNFDGKPEVLIGGWSHNLTLLSNSGSVIFKKDLGGTINASPAIIDVRGDFKPEIIAGTDYGDLYILDKFGNVLDVFNAETAIRSSPVFADIDGNGRNDIIFGSDNNNLYAINGNAVLLWKFAAKDRITASPTLADLNRNGKPEILFPSEDHYLYCLDINGKMKWKVNNIEGIMSSPVVADLDGDDIPEVIYGNLDKELNVLNENNKKIFTYKTGDMIFTTPAIGDLDQNNKLDIVVASTDGYLYFFETVIPSGMILWSRWRGDSLGTGSFENSVLFSLTNIYNDVKK